MKTKKYRWNYKKALHSLAVLATGAVWAALLVWNTCTWILTA